MNPTTDFSTTHECHLTQGTIRYREVGSGPTLVFVHGLLVNGTLWRDVVPPLAAHFHCVVPDLPLGAHPYPLHPQAERSPIGVARLLADFLAALDLHNVTLIGNDTGGAICQLTIARHPERITGLVLTNCDAYEAFLPFLLSPFQHGARLFGARFGTFLARVLRARFAQRALLWTVSLRRPDDATLDVYFAPMLRDTAVRDDLVRFVAAITKRDTLDAAMAFPHFRHPVLLVWGRSDFFFSARYARRLQRDFPHATLTFLPHSRAFVPEDQPQRLAALIADFLRPPATMAASRQEMAHTPRPA
jgi:pimeloyl-ACP methyl ester carboxylesterase